MIINGISCKATLLSPGSCFRDRISAQSQHSSEKILKKQLQKGDLVWCRRQGNSQRNPAYSLQVNQILKLPIVICGTTSLTSWFANLCGSISSRKAGRFRAGISDVLREFLWTTLAEILAGFFFELEWLNWRGPWTSSGRVVEFEGFKSVEL